MLRALTITLTRSHFAADFSLLLELGVKSFPLYAGTAVVGGALGAAWYRSLLPKKGEVPAPKA